MLFVSRDSDLLSRGSISGNIILLIWSADIYKTKYINMGKNMINYSINSILSTLRNSQKKCNCCFKLRLLTIVLMLNLEGPSNYREPYMYRK